MRSNLDGEGSGTNPQGGVLEPVSGARRALVTVVDESAEVTALLSEPALAADWNRPEEDAAWQHLQGAV
jgi:hypothetical protein